MCTEIGGQHPGVMIGGVVHDQEEAATAGSMAQQHAQEDPQDEAIELRILLSEQLPLAAMSKRKCPLKVACTTVTGGSRGPLLPLGGRRYDNRDS
jgi:hypothetical protein